MSLLVERTAQMIEWLDEHGCSDGDCKVKHTKNSGMVTNGGCSCLRNMPYFDQSRVLLFHRKLGEYSMSAADKRIAELEDKLNTDSQNFQLECQKEEIKLLQATIERVRELPDEWIRRGSAMMDAQGCLDDLREALGDKV